MRHRWLNARMQGRENYKIIVADSGLGNVISKFLNDIKNAELGLYI